MHSFRFTVRPLVLLLALVFSSAASAQSPAGTSDWETLRPEGEVFSVKMPKGSASESSKEPYHKMELNFRTYISNRQGGPVLAVVSLSGIKSNPQMYSEMQRVNSYVDAFKNLFSAKIRPKGPVAKLTLVGEKTLQGNPGREYRMTVGDLSGLAQVYATRKRFYAIVYLNSEKEDAIQDQFISSFVLPERVFQSPEVTATVDQQSIPAVRRGVQSRINQNPPAKTEPEDDAEPEEGAPPTTGAETNADEGGAKPTEPNQQPGQKAPVSGGLLNSKATSLPQPVFPPTALQTKASGTVVVKVLIDEQGNVISANAVSGHPLLQAAAVEAARQARFQPTFLMGESVKVTGIITYNFVRP